MIWTIFLPLVFGFIVGYTSKHPPKSFLFWISLFLLLFFVGYRTGSSVSSFIEFGKIIGDSLMISLVSIIGSIIFVIPLWRKIK